MLFSIFMPRIAAALVEQGFPIVKIEQGKNNPKYKVYQFEDTIEFQLALNKIIEKEKKKKKNEK